MSIDKVEVMNSQGDLLAFSLEDISSGYIVKEIEGLDPVKATLVSSDFASMPGQQFQSSSRETRNVVIKLGYAPNFSINDTVRVLRTRLYDFFMPEEEVLLTFYMADGLVVNISGIVETCGSPLFAKDSQTDISIVCFKPDFIDRDVTQLYDVFTTGDIEPKIINYRGSVKTALTSLRFTVPADTSEFSIYHTTPRGTMRSMLISAPLLAGDVVEMCTIPGEKSITMTRGSVETSILWAVSPQSDWVLLERGPNQFRVYVDTVETSPVLIDYSNRYGGL